MSKLILLKKYSNPDEVMRRAASLGYPPVLISSKTDKKYMINTPDNHIVHFGQMGYSDFTKTKDKTKRENYLKRATKIKGNWKANKYSPNNLAIHLLW